VDLLLLVTTRFSSCLDCVSFLGSNGLQVVWSVDGLLKLGATLTYFLMTVSFWNNNGWMSEQGVEVAGQSVGGSRLCPHKR